MFGTMTKDHCSKRPALVVAIPLENATPCSDFYRIQSDLLVQHKCTCICKSIDTRHTGRQPTDFDGVAVQHSLTDVNWRDTNTVAGVYPARASIYTKGNCIMSIKLVQNCACSWTRVLYTHIWPMTRATELLGSIVGL